MMSMNLFVTFTFLIMHMILLPEVRGQPCNETYIKLCQHHVDQLYARLLKTDAVFSRWMCAMRCSITEMCRLFQFKDGQCKLLKQEAGPRITITSLTGMTEVWSVDLGKVTTLSLYLDL